MNAIIIAAGKGTRLRPLTNTTPKPLVKIFGKPMIENNIEYLIEAGVEEIIVVVGYLREKFDYLAYKYPQIKLVYNSEYSRYNNIYSLYLVRNYLKDSYILEGDIYLTKNIFDKNIKESVYFSKKPNYENDEWQLLLKDNKIENIVIGGKNNYIMSGISFWNKEESEKIKKYLLEYIKDEEKAKNDYWDHIIKENIDKFNVGIHQLDNETITEIDNLEELKEVDNSYITLLTPSKVKTAVILAAGKSRDYSYPNGLIEIDNEILIERNISLLTKYGIEKIYIVIGFEREKYFYLKNKYENVTLIENQDYSTGSYNSFMLLKNKIEEDILLLDSDIIYEERALKNLLQNIEKNIILVSDEKGQKDESFVEEESGRLKHISKDMRELKAVQGEMLGVAKLSKELVENIFNLEVKNSKYAYEYAISESAKNFYIKTLRIDNLLWGEIDSKHAYNYVMDNLIRRIRKVELDSFFEEVKGLLVQNLGIKLEDIEDIEPLGGLTNKNYQVIISGKKYAVRYPGVGSSDLVDRSNEAKNAKIMSDLNIDAHLFFYDAKTGFKVSEYIRDAQTLNPTIAKYNLKDVADILRKTHTSGAKFDLTFDCFDEMIRYDVLCKKINAKFCDGYNEIKEIVMDLENKLKSLNIELCCCHNDALAENFVRNDERVYLVDWEYSGMNDPMWDLAAFSLESGLSADEENKFYDFYFSGNTKSEERLRIEIYKICQDFLWSLWGAAREANGADLGNYVIDRFTNAIKGLEKLGYYEKI